MINRKTLRSMAQHVQAARGKWAPRYGGTGQCSVLLRASRDSGFGWRGQGEARLLWVKFPSLKFLLLPMLPLGQFGTKELCAEGDER
ncbi:hypothetical protein E2C01_018191 [Portunus trituberculatus]|uniref:Uncharacterized protein n=1 Tax=Portunus trituberculatus TaxID=210409 RepID=A0A5B7DUE2_PORTR|nr:hypothetical protein [Portunus trituberculatus]